MDEYSTDVLSVGWTPEVADALAAEHADQDVRDLTAHQLMNRRIAWYTHTDMSAVRPPTSFHLFAVRRSQCRMIWA